MPAVSINRRINNMTLDEISKRELRAMLQALLDAQQAQADSLDTDSGVTATTARATLDSYIKE